MSNNLQKMSEQTGLYFSIYEEALDWIYVIAGGKYKSVDSFFQTKKYAKALPLIRELAFEELKRANLQIGDKVIYENIILENDDELNFIMRTLSGTITERFGIPFVKLDKGQTNLSGGKFVVWWRKFKKVS
jgi:hypothetical protein